MKSVLKIFGGLLELIFIVYAVFMILLVMSTNKYGFTQIGDYTFIPVDEYTITELYNFKENDLLITKSARYNDINVGDTIYYYSTVDETYIVQFGKIASKEGDNRSALYTLEENSKMTLSTERLIGHEFKLLPKLGSFYNTVTSTTGFLILVIFPMLLIFIYQVYNFIILLKEDKELTKSEEASENQ